MNKTVVLSICALLFLGVIVTALNMKNAYRMIPVQMSEEMKVPPYADWREFIPQSKKFKVMLPTVPQYAQDSNLIANTEQKRFYEMFISEKLNGAIFMISQITYPAEYNVNTRQLLKDTIDEMVKSNPDNTLNFVNDTTFLDQTAFDFNITNKDFGVDGKAFMYGKTIYLLTYIAKNAEFNKEEYKHFLDSFHLLTQKE
jgi:hypothetical protein